MARKSKLLGIKCHHTIGHTSGVFPSINFCWLHWRSSEVYISLQYIYGKNTFEYPTKLGMTNVVSIEGRGADTITTRCPGTPCAIFFVRNSDRQI